MAYLKQSPFQFLFELLAFLIFAIALITLPALVSDKPAYDDDNAFCVISELCVEE